MVTSCLTDTGGLGRAVANLANHLAEVFPAVTVVGPSRREGQQSYELRRVQPHTRQLFKSCITLATYPMRAEWKHRLQSGAEITTALEAACTDQTTTTIHIHGIWTHTARDAMNYAWKRGIRTVVSPHGMLQPSAVGHHRFRKQLAWSLGVRRGLSKAEVFHAASPIEQEAILRVLPESNVVVAPHPLDYALVRPANDFPKVPIKFLYLGRIEPEKGISLLLDAWTRIPNRNQHLTLMGTISASYKATLTKRLASDPALRNVNVEAEVPPDHALHSIDSHHILVHPSRSENFGLAIAEAMCRGRPVITTTPTPWPEIQSRSAGWCVPPTPDALATAIQAATSTSVRDLASIATNARNWMQQSYSWEVLKGTYMSRIYDAPV